MEFCEKLQELRKQKGLTQEDLAGALFVSRTAISKWESGRGYPNIDSLKAIAAFFELSVDDLLSGDELLTLAEETTKQTKNHLRDLVFGLLDCSAATLLFLPFFRQAINGAFKAVSLLSLTAVAAYMRAAYLVLVIGMVLCGVLTLALQNCTHPCWTKSKTIVSLTVNAATALLLTLGLQPYAAVFAFVFLIIKVFILAKNV